MKILRYIAIAPITLGLAAVAGAHHSAVQFDFGKQVQYTGTVKQFMAINPHMRLTIELKNSSGTGTHEVKFEGHSTNNMYRSGYRKGMVKTGETVTVNAAPYRDGTEGGYVIAVTLADGTFFGAKGRAQDAQRTAEEVRRQAEGR
ncbi:MAG: DUF6152 family protein [Pseudomonadota bacterium]